MSGPDAGLRRAFLETTYGTAERRVRLDLQRGHPSPPVWATCQRWAILTAWNPHGAQQSAALNDAAQARLRAELSGQNLLEGVNGVGEWAEASLIVPGLGLRRALELGQRYAQAAVLWGVGLRAALVWCESAHIQRLWLRPWDT